MTGLNYVRLLWGCDSGVGTDGGVPIAGWVTDGGKAGHSSGAGPRRIPPHMTSGPYHERSVSRARVTSGPPREPVSRAARVVSGPYRALASLGAARVELEPHPCGGFGTEASRTPSATASEIVGETTLAPTRAVNICCRSRPRESPRPALIWLIDFVMSPTI